MFYVSARHDLAVAQIPKAGLTTIREWLGPDFRVVPNDQARRFSRRVAFIRHPLERLKSCYSFMYWQLEYGASNKRKVPLGSWEAFVDYMLAHDDEHWRPQSAHVGDVPNIYHRFEDLPDLFERYRPGLLPHNNRATRLPTSDYRQGEIMDFYRDDLELWSDAKWR